VLWEAAAEADLPVAIHVGDPPEFFDPVTPNNDRYHELLMHPEWWFGSGEYPSLGEIHEQFESVVSRHPSTTFIGLHFGCFMSFADVARMLNTYDNYCVDTAARIEDLGRGDVGRVRSVFERFPERIIFGTDLARTEIFEMPDLGEKREDVREFYERHWSFFETGKDGLPLPLPFGRSWTLTGLELDQQTLERLYFKNAFRVFRLLDRALGTQT
jgi:predicted TIM-barrel fold metal-dependent hydrolase